MKKKLCCTNKDALRWCKTRRAKIIFNEMDDSGIVCVVFLGKREKYGKTLIQAVNNWIKHFNKDQT